MTTQETALVRVPSYDEKQLTLIKQTVAKGTSDAEFALFIQVCLTTGLNPFARQIYAVMRKDQGQSKMTIQTGIDGYRLLAQRTGKYRGQTPVEWCGPDGKWVDVWLKDDPPAAARVGVYYVDFPHPTYAVARYKSYAATYQNGAPMPMWAKMPEVMLAKCAEALALRKVFPGELSGIYTKEEMEQADGPLPQPTVTEVAHDEQVPTVEGEIIEAQPQIASEKPATSQVSNHSTKNGTAMPAPQGQANGLSEEQHKAKVDALKKRASSVGAFNDALSMARYLYALLERKVTSTKTLTLDEMTRIDLDLANREHAVKEEEQAV